MTRIFTTVVFLALLSPATIQAASDLTRSQALSNISSSAYQKVETEVLYRLLEESQSEFIVEFSRGNRVNHEMSRKLFLDSLTSQYDNIKDRVLNRITHQGVSYIKNYSVLPMAFVRSQSRQALTELINAPRVLAIYENEAHTFNLVQSLPQIRQPDIRALEHRGDNTSVAILDTGVDYTSAAFGCTSPRVPLGCPVVESFDTAPDDNQLDALGHGTNVAGIAAGVAPGASIVAIDVFEGIYAYSADIIAAIDWVVANQHVHNIVAMNLSLGNRQGFTNECSNSWATAPFAQARSVGVIPVVSSGNSGFLDGVSSPACAPGAVRVGAVYDYNGYYYGSSCSDLTVVDKVACFSNSDDDLLTILAPGCEITAAGRTHCGTSQAAPFIAGAVSIMRAEDVAPDDTLQQTIERMVRTGANITDHRNGVQKPRIDLYQAVQDADGGDQKSQTLLIDFGSLSKSTEIDGWNNVTEVWGCRDGARFTDLVNTQNKTTPIELEILSRFNGANNEGTLNSIHFTSTVTSDSLFGNTENWDGLTNVMPSFKLSGLNPWRAYHFTFYASRMGVGDIRETSYTVVGRNTTRVELDPANNNNNVVETSMGIIPDQMNEITISLAPTENNNNPYHFVYLGAMKVVDDDIGDQEILQTLLIDFGSLSTPADITGWNNLTEYTGRMVGAQLTNLVNTQNEGTLINLEILSRFNGANTDGTLSSTHFPPGVTRDSLFGNTESWDGLTNVAPSFKLSGLNPQRVYRLTFYASRLGVGDIRETKYTIVGQNTTAVALDPAKNINNTVVSAGVIPDGMNEITISLAPTKNNNNRYHFTYLGAMKVEEMNP